MPNFAIRSLFLATISPLALSVPAFAQQTQPTTAAPVDAEANEQSEIIVTGTRRTDRTVADSPVPVDVIGERGDRPIRARPKPTRS